MDLQSRQKGFSLVELLIYAGLTAIILGLFSGILITILRIQTQQTASRQLATELNFVMNTIKHEIRSADAIGVSSSTLTLATSSSSTNPTIITTENQAITIQKGGASVTTLTTDKIRVDNLAFLDLADQGSEAVQIILQFSYASDNPTQAESQTLKSTAAPLRKIN